MSTTIETLKAIVSIPSYVDGPHNEKQLADYIFNLLSQNKNLKIVKQIVEGERYNIIATDQDPQIILFGHMDTVLPKEQEKDPLVAYEEDGKVYGLGSVDMKSGLAVMLDIALNHHKSNVGYVFSVDEEYDFKGAMKLKEITTLHPKYILNLEPTNQKILNGCRGITEFEFEVIGKSAHAGRKMLGKNSIELGVDIVKELESICKAEDAKDVSSSVNLAHLVGGIKSNNDDEIRRMGNVVPNYAKIVAEIRIASKSITKEFVEKSLKDLALNKGIEIANLKFKFYLGSMFTPKEDLILFENSIKAQGMVPEYSDVNSAGYFELQIIESSWGGKGVVYGAGPSEMSHCENEYVEVTSVDKVQKVVLEFISSLN
jgi:acetylornithine deacetylase/succinyl-diaminopimelate desuccinylase-like protein